MEDTSFAIILNHFIANNNDMFQDIEVCDTPHSDHIIVKIYLTTDPPYQPILAPKEFERHTFRSLNFDKANWEAMNRHLSEIDWEYLKTCCCDENEFPELFRFTLLQMCSLYTPLKPNSIKPFKPSGSRSCRIISRKKKLQALQSQPHCSRLAEKLESELALLHINMRDEIHGELEQREREAVNKVKKNPNRFL